MRLTSLTPTRMTGALSGVSIGWDCWPGADGCAALGVCAGFGEADAGAGFVAGAGGCCACWAKTGNATARTRPKSFVVISPFILPMARRGNRGSSYGGIYGVGSTGVEAIEQLGEFPR